MDGPKAKCGQKQTRRGDKENTFNVFPYPLFLKDVRRGEGREYGQMRTPADRGMGKGPCGRLQDDTFLELFQHALQTLPMADDYLSIKTYPICTTEYNMGWH